MQLLTDISQDANQKHTVIMDNGEEIVVNLRYNPTQQGWYIDVAYETGSFELKGIRVCTSPNLLRQWKNIIPFGLMITCEKNYEPVFLEDFVVGRCSLAILTADEVKTVEARYES
jgi:hypothetical protein